MLRGRHGIPLPWTAGYVVIAIPGGPRRGAAGPISAARQFRLLADLSSGGKSEDHTGQVIEPGAIRRDEDSTRRKGGGGDDEVVGAAVPACFSDRDEQLRVGPGHVEVVADDRQGLNHVVQEGPTCLSALALGDLDPYAELGDRDSRDGRLIVISDQGIQIRR